MHTYWLLNAIANENHVLMFARETDPTRAEYEEREVESARFRVRLINVAKRNPFWAYYRDGMVEEKFKHLITAFKPDIVFIGHTVGLSAALIEIAADSGVPTLVHLRDFFYTCHRLFLLKSDSSLCSGPLDGSKCAECMAPDLKVAKNNEALAPGVERTQYMKHVLNKANLLFAHSTFLAQKYVEFGVPVHKVRVVEGGIDMNGLSQNYHRTTAERLRFGYLGTISLMKGVANLIDAFVKLPRDGSELHIHGSTPNNQYLDQLKRRAEAHRVYFHGEYDRNRIGEVLSNIDVLVHPSIVPEAYSLTIREAFAANIPVIVSNLRAQSDAVQNGVNGLHFKAGVTEDLRRKMRLLADNPGVVSDFRKKMPPVRSIENQATEIKSILLQLCES